MRNRIIYFLLVLLLLGTLAGCNNSNDTPASQGGTLYLNTSSVISVTYDEKGIVTAISAESENAKEIIENYQDFENKTCSEVLAELVEKIGEAGHLDNEDAIEITFDENAQLPETSFEENIKQQIQNTLETNEWTGTVTVEASKNTSDTTNSETESETEIVSNIPEGATQQSDGTYLYTAYLDSQQNITESVENAQFICTYVYSADGHLFSENTLWKDTEKAHAYIEYYPNGNPKTFKNWNENGVLVREFTSFHNENAQNGILSEYNSTTGKLEYRTMEGNPDGSPATSEQWLEENGGEHVVSIYNTSYLSDSGAQVVETRYTLDSGAYHYHTYDYENETMHTIGFWPESNSKRDLITSLMTDEPIEGYTESTIDGIYTRREWKNGMLSFQISDGASYMGYKVKDTTYYYSNGNVKSFERYFYKDGGHYYVEFDENGNETFNEITTAYY